MILLDANPFAGGFGVFIGVAFLLVFLAIAFIAFKSSVCVLLVEEMKNAVPPPALAIWLIVVCETPAMPIT